MEPRTPLEAVTHTDAYPYYVSLVAERPFARDAGLGLWVAARAGVVEAVLASHDLAVRPGSSPVRDPAANPDPDRFDTARRAPRQFTVGAGPHRCPGEAFAVTIAARVVHDFARGGHSLDRPRGPVAYQPLPNVRIPDLGGGM